jgi:poly(beta-D-mannuronate) lyase
MYITNIRSHVAIKFVLVALMLLMGGCKSKAMQLEQSTTVDNNSKSSVRCPKDAPEPFTGALTIQSKYNQSDKSKSTLSASRDKQSVQIQREVKTYVKGLVRFSDYAVTPGKSKKQAIAQSCLHEWLSVWAKADALTTKDTTKTGIAVRKWTLASIAFVAIKTERMSQGQWALNATDKQWLSNLASLVIDDYNPRLTSDFKYFNNHDHWAAWAVFSTGMLLDNKELMGWGKRVFDKALTLAVVDTKKHYAYFPNEIARKQLAANYTHFSLTPLVLLAHYLPKKGFSVSEQQQKTISYMANFASDIVLKPGAVKQIVKVKQSSVKDYKLAWLLPYLKEHPSHKSARALYEDRGGKVDGYSQLGGKIRPLYEK